MGKERIAETGDLVAKLYYGGKIAGSIKLGRKFKLGDDTIYTFSMFIRDGYLNNNADENEQYFGETEDPRFWLTTRSMDELRIDWKFNRSTGKLYNG